MGRSVSAEASRKREAKASAEFARARGKFWLWAGLLIAPLVFLLHLQANYALVTQLCQSTHKIASHLVTLLSLLISAAGALISWRNFQAAGQKFPGEGASVLERSRLMAAIGILMSLLFMLILIAQWIPQFIFDPCAR